MWHTIINRLRTAGRLFPRSLPPGSVFLLNLNYQRLWCRRETNQSYSLICTTFPFPLPFTSSLRWHDRNSESKVRNKALTWKVKKIIITLLRTESSIFIDSPLCFQLICWTEQKFKDKMTLSKCGLCSKS